MSLDPLHLAVALVPLAAYFLMLGQVHLRRRPLVTTGWRDTLVLGLGISGLMMIGPMELFFPEAAVDLFGPYVWLLIGILFALLVMLVALVQRPRLIIMGVTAHQIQPALERAVGNLEPAAQWTGSVCYLPNVGIQFEVVESPGMRVVQMIATGGEQQLDGWRRLLVALRRQSEELHVGPTAAGASWLILAAMLLALAVYGLVSYSQPLDGPISDMLRQ
jgi:hypothetical protein